MTTIPDEVATSMETTPGATLMEIVPTAQTTLDVEATSTKPASYHWLGKNIQKGRARVP